MKTVLVAEDERAARVSLAALLEAAGLRVIPAEDGRTALSLLLQEEPDAALLDMTQLRFNWHNAWTAFPFTGPTPCRLRVAGRSVSPFSSDLWWNVQ